MSGRGLDVGTAFLVSSKLTGAEGSSQILYRKMRNAFLEIPADEGSEAMLRQASVAFIPGRNGSKIILGDASLSMASMFKDSVLRRPLAKGVIAKGEAQAVTVLGAMLKSVLEAPEVPGEVCYYSVPAASMDTGQDSVFHSAQVGKLISDLGFTAKPLNEALAVIYSQCQETQFTGLALSWGAGMVNGVLTYRSLEAAKFAVSRGGDWVDERVSEALGLSRPRVTKIKEKAWDIRAPANQEQSALSEYYKRLIQYTVEHLAETLREKDVYFDEPIPVVLSGGTTMVGGFVETFQESLESVGLEQEFLPAVRAPDPLQVVAHGLLVAAKNL